MNARPRLIEPLPAHRLDTARLAANLAQHIEGFGRALAVRGNRTRPVGAVTYLCSEAATFVTGIDLRADGGTTSALRHMIQPELHANQGGRDAHR